MLKALTKSIPLGALGVLRVAMGMDGNGIIGNEARAHVAKSTKSVERAGVFVANLDSRAHASVAPEPLRARRNKQENIHFGWLVLKGLEQLDLAAGS